MPVSNRKITVIIIIITLILGIFSTWFLWKLTAHRLAEEALEQACIVAESLNLKRLENLNGNSEDLNSEDYLRLKEQLAHIRKTHRTCRFLYLMGRKKDGTVFFFLDSQPENSKDYAPPGLVYDEVSPEYLYTFDTGKQRTVGPITDRWGTLITSLVPIYSKDNKKLIAVLGMDVNAEDWKRKIISQCLLPISLTASIILLTILIVIINVNRQKIKAQYIEKNRIAIELEKTLQHVKQLKGLLPICAWCNKIKDDEGNWNELENYIEKNSEAQFSHGICKECSKKHYGDESWYQHKEN